MDAASDPHRAYRIYGPALVRKAGRILGNRDDAGDVVQALFVDLIADGARSLDLPYLYRAITNRCLNLMRDAANRARLLAREQPSLAVHRLTCADQIVGLDLLGRLDAVLDRKHMDVLVCRFVDEMGQEEIAALLGVSRKTVQHRLDRIHREVAKLTDRVAREVAP